MIAARKFDALHEAARGCPQFIRPGLYHVLSWKSSGVDRTDTRLSTNNFGEYGMRAQSLKFAAGLVGLAIVLSGCGGGGGGGSNSPATSGSGTSSGGSTSAGPASMLPAATTLSPIGIGLKQLQLKWSDVAGATFYRVLEDADGNGFVQLGGDLPGTQTSFNRDIAVHQQNWAAARYEVQACNTEGCSTSAAGGATSGVLQAVGYLKASNTNDADTFGWVLALSADGNTLAVGAPGESSNASGIGGDQSNNSTADAGAVYVFSRGSNGSWSQQAYLKASTSHLGDTFGEALSISSDGNTLVAGAPLENGAATGVGGNQGALTANDAGAAYVFFRSGSTWTQQAYLKASNTAANAYFGWATAVSADGNTLAVSAVGDASAATGINGNQSDRTAADAGAVYVFGRSGSTWSQKVYLKASNTGAGDNFGTALTLNSAGSVLAVGAPYEASAATGINGSQSSNASTDAGAVYVFTGSGTNWTQVAYVKASNTGAGDNFGASVSLNGAGTLLAVGAPYESSSATGVNGSQSSNSTALSGAVYLFSPSGNVWSQSTYLKSSNTGTNDNFGMAVALGSAGDTLVVGAIGESSSATGLNGSQTDNSKDGVGAAYIFKLTGSSWAQQTYLKPATAQAASEFGSTIGLSADTKTLAIGATFEGGDGKGVTAGDLVKQASVLAPESGAVWLY